MFKTKASVFKFCMLCYSTKGNDKDVCMDYFTHVKCSKGKRQQTLFLFCFKENGAICHTNSFFDSLSVLSSSSYVTITLTSMPATIFSSSFLDH